MIALAWHTARARSASLAGSFIATALGVALLTVMTLILASTIGAPSHPRWFTKPDVVVAGDNSVSVTTGTGEGRETSAATTAEAQAVPAALASHLGGLGATMVADYAGYASAAGVPGNTIHPWSAAALHDYTWVSGGPPRRAGQLVLTAPARFRPGNEVVVQTSAGPRRFTVSGVIRTAAPAAMYASNAVAAGLAHGRIDALALTARPGEAPGTLVTQVRAAARGEPVRVLTGDQRRAAEPDPDADLFAVAVSLLGVTSGLAGFVAIFVVAGTFAHAVAARPRELGLLRTVGATPRQARRLVLGEALAAGIAAALAGGALGIVIAGPFAHWLARSGFAPHDFTAHFILWPVAAAAGAGLLIALAGAFVAARRAGRVRPAEALREAAVDRGTMPLTRWVVGLAALGGTVPLFGVLVGAHSVDQAALILPITMLLVAGFAMLVAAGRLADLTGTGTVAVPAGTWRLGQTASLWLGDSAPVHLRVVAVLADQIDTEQTVLLPWALRDAHTATPLASAVYLRLAPGAGLAAVRRAAAAGGGTVSSTASYLSASDAQNNRDNNLALIAVLGLALVYTGIAIANTLVMATASRNRELATLRLSGAAPGQVLRMIGVEALLVSGIGTLLAAGVTAVTVVGLRHGLAPLAPSVRVVVPWLPLGGIALACLVVALLASIIPASLALRRPPLELAGGHE